MKRRLPLPVIASGVGDFREAGSIPSDRWKAVEGRERLVATHCAFCGAAHPIARWSTGRADHGLPPVIEV